jgi:hypothetical protein
MKQRALSAILIGLFLVTTPLSLERIPLTFTFPLMAKIAVGIYGIFLIAGGFMVAGAERYKLLLDFYLLLGLALFAIGPPTKYIVGKEFWTTITLVAAIFIGLPAVLLLHLDGQEV